MLIEIWMISFSTGIPANLADQLKQYYAEGIELSMKELK